MADGRAAQAAVELVGLTPYHRRLTLLCGITNAVDAVEILSVGFVVPLVDADFRLSGGEKGALTGVIFLGMLLGSWVFGSLADNFGRRKMLMASLALSGLAGMLSPAVPSFWWLLSLRFASGFGVGGTIPTMFAYASESLPLKVRERYIIFISMFWMTGALVVSAIAWGMLPDVDAGANVASDSCTRMWRPFLVVAAAPALACALLFHGALESPAFLVARGRDAEAVSVLMRIAHWRLRGAAASVTREALREAIQTSRAREQGGSERDDLLAAAPDGPAVAVSSSLGDSRAADSDSEGVGRSSESSAEEEPTSLDFTDQCVLVMRRSALLLRKPRFRWATLPLLVIWFCLALGFYGLTLWTPEYFSLRHISLNVYLSTLVSNAAQLPGSLLSIFLVKRLGAERTLAATMLLSAGAVYLFLVVSADAQLVAVSSLFSFVSVGGWNALNIASAVHIPPALRSSAFGLFSAAGRLGAIAGNITFGLLVEANAGIPITIVASLLAVGAVFAVLLGAQSRPLETPSAAV